MGCRIIVPNGQLRSDKVALGDTWQPLTATLAFQDRGVQQASMSGVDWKTISAWHELLFFKIYKVYYKVYYNILSTSTAGWLYWSIKPTNCLFSLGIPWPLSRTEGAIPPAYLWCRLEVDPQCFRTWKRLWMLWLLAVTIWLFNIAMENGPFIDGLPITNGDFPWLC
jgi:hypothetical protein